MQTNGNKFCVYRFLLFHAVKALGMHSTFLGNNIFTQKRKLVDNKQLYCVILVLLFILVSTF